eukprot:scaffold213_cov245-Pinguiococcus_pyrenoidosus.AAC.33
MLSCRMSILCRQSVDMSCSQSRVTRSTPNAVGFPSIPWIPHSETSSAVTEPKPIYRNDTSFPASACRCVRNLSSRRTWTTAGGRPFSLSGRSSDSPSGDRRLTQIIRPHRCDRVRQSGTMASKEADSADLILSSLSVLGNSRVRERRMLAETGAISTCVIGTLSTASRSRSPRSAGPCRSRSSLSSSLLELSALVSEVVTSASLPA